VTLAVGMTNIFTGLPWFKNLASYFFQFVVMFEAVFILTAVDSGTRIARYLLQDLSGTFYAPLKRVDWLPGMLATSFVACLLWGYLLASGDIASIWALFGVSNQLMASVGLIIGATVILKLSRRFSYMLTCLIPLAYLFVTVYVAGVWMVVHVYLNPAVKGYNPFNATITIIELVLGAIILVAALARWFTTPGKAAPVAA
jgi:carbon starvation protein